MEKQEQEQKLLESYRKLRPESKRRIMAAVTAAALAEPGQPQRTPEADPLRTAQSAVPLQHIQA